MAQHSIEETSEHVSKFLEVKSEISRLDTIKKSLDSALRPAIMALGDKLETGSYVLPLSTGTATMQRRGSLSVDEEACDAYFKKASLSLMASVIKRQYVVSDKVEEALNNVKLRMAIKTLISAGVIECKTSYSKEAIEANVKNGLIPRSDVLGLLKEAESTYALIVTSAVKDNSGGVL